jgi:thiosulfate reductase cytochrome b subunit
MTGSLGVDLFIIFCFLIILIALPYVIYNMRDPFAKNRRKKRLKRFKDFHRDRLERFRVRQKHLRKLRNIKRKYRG